MRIGTTQQSGVVNARSLLEILLIRKLGVSYGAIRRKQVQITPNLLSRLSLLLRLLLQGLSDR
jgi:hypothetical protein